MNKIKKLVKEAFFVGLLVLGMGTVVSKIVGSTLSVPLPTACKSWNKYHVMEISLFLTGVLAHIFCEVTGINKWYCKHGAAC